MSGECISQTSKTNERKMDNMNMAEKFAKENFGIVMGDIIGDTAHYKPHINRLRVEEIDIIDGKFSAKDGVSVRFCGPNIKKNGEAGKLNGVAWRRT
jgi:hypothetical protein